MSTLWRRRKRGDEQVAGREERAAGVEEQGAFFGETDVEAEVVVGEEVFPNLFGVVVDVDDESPGL